APMARGRTDVERLREGELVYTGALRTPVEAIAPTVPVGGRPTGVSAEGFALAGDVHVWRGDLAAADYSVPTPDGRPATREFAGERLARVVCADREMLDETDIGVIADALWDAQITRIGAGLERCARGNPRWHARSSRDSVSFSPRPPPGASGCKSRISRTPSGPRRGTPPRRPWRCCSHHDGRHPVGS